MGKCRKCGKSTMGSFTLCFVCSEKHKADKFHKYGKTKCKICGKMISADSTHCWPCYKKYVLKK